MEVENERERERYKERETERESVCVCVCVYVCVCVCARARACVCLCVGVLRNLFIAISFIQLNPLIYVCGALSTRKLNLNSSPRISPILISIS